VRLWSVRCTVVAVHLSGLIEGEEQMKSLDIIIILIISILLIIALWVTPCRPQKPQPILKELSEEVSDLEKDIAYAIWNKKRLYYTLWIIKDLTKVHIREAKNYDTTGNFHHWTKKYKHNSKINILEEP